MTRKHIFILLSTVFILTNAHAQNSKDSLRVEELIKKAKQATPDSKKKALKYANEALAVSQEIKHEDLTAVSFHTIGQVYNTHDEFILAEQNLREWYKIRMNQGYYRQRWAMNGMRSFYSKFKKIEKLQEVDDVWVAKIDSNFINDIKFNGLRYGSSIRVVIGNYIRLGEYRIAENYFNHWLEITNDKPDWLNASMMYFYGERMMRLDGDLAYIKQWYSNWFALLNAEEPDPIIMQRTINTIISRLNTNEVVEIGGMVLDECKKYVSDSTLYFIYVESINKKNPIEHTFEMNIKAMELAAKINPEKVDLHRRLFLSVYNTEKTIRDETAESILIALREHGITSLNAEVRELSQNLIKKLEN